jgi:protocatechuate 3,4-dioxygenase beta subunit
MRETTSYAVRGWMRAILLLVGMTVMTGAAQAAAQDGRVVGRVTDGTGNPVAGARVTLVTADAPQRARTAVTGETGGFEFAAVPAGSYRLKADGAGRASREVAVVVEAGEVESVVTRLASARTSRREAEREPNPRRAP